MQRVIWENIFLTFFCPKTCLLIFLAFRLHTNKTLRRMSWIQSVCVLRMFLNCKWMNIIFMHVTVCRFSCLSWTKVKFFILSILIKENRIKQIYVHLAPSLNRRCPFILVIKILVNFSAKTIAQRKNSTVKKREKSDILPSCLY